MTGGLILALGESSCVKSIMIASAGGLENRVVTLESYLSDISQTSMNAKPLEEFSHFQCRLYLKPGWGKQGLESRKIN